MMFENNVYKAPHTHTHTHTHPQTPTDTLRHPQTPSDTHRHPQTPSDTHRHPQTPSDTLTGEQSINRIQPSWERYSFKMPYRHRRACPICGTSNLLNLSGHLRQVHGLWSEDQRQPWLKRASHLPPPVALPMEQCPVNLPPNSGPVIPSNNSPVHSVEPQPYPEFKFQHPFSMMVVGPSQCGKTCFVYQLLTHKRFSFPDKKPVMVCWCYNQWQPIYDEIQCALKGKIKFVQGLPELENDLGAIKTSRHTIIVLDDLMAEAKDSPVVSKLFTQGRHRNASVLLLLQNMFPKGKYNTDISRNATYKVLFWSPGDRKQIDMMPEHTFAKDRPYFMKAYNRETAHPYGYIVVDNHPQTNNEHQVVGNVFDDCYAYPLTNTNSPKRNETPSVSTANSTYVPSPLREPQRETSRKRAAEKVTAPRVKKRKTLPSQKTKEPHITSADEDENDESMLLCERSYSDYPSYPWTK